MFDYALKASLLQVKVKKIAETEVKKLLFTGVFFTQKMQFSMEDFLSKCHKIRKKLQIWSHLLKKSIMENLIF